MVGLQLTLFGGFDARCASGVVNLPTKKAQALLAYLALRPGQSHPRDKLAALLWGDKSDEQARGDLRHALVGLRRALSAMTPSLLRVEGRILSLGPDGLEVDVVRFEQCIAEGTPAALEAAAELYRGDLLLGFTLSEPLFEDWLVAERERLREMALEALARLLAHKTKETSSEAAIRTAVRLLALDPLQEVVHRALMRLYVRQGRRGAALKQYQACVTALRRELGTEPEEETRQLYRDLLRRAGQSAQEPSVPAEHRPSRAFSAGSPLPDLPAAETPLFGRLPELAQLRQMLGAAVRGHGQLATVIGEAGIGKTRLLSAVGADALSLGCRILVGRCHESDSILPFGPWVDAIRTGGICDDEATLDALHPTRRAELVHLFPEVDRARLPRPSDSALPLFESVSALIEQVAKREPLMLVLEDLHWADEMTLRLLAFVGRRLSAWPVFLMVTARDEELADASMARQTLGDLARAPQAFGVTLSALSRPDTARLVRALTRAGRHASAGARVEERIWAMSEGNPFVVVESMRALDQDALWASPHEEPGAPALPASVRDLVARRLDRLGVRSQQLAAVAAVIARRFDFALLHAAGGADERETAEAVEEMVRQRVFQAVGDQLDFTHDRIREVAYGRIIPARRRLLHRAVAEALEAFSGPADSGEARPAERSGDRIEQLAYHALRGELTEKAVRYLRQAGTRAAAQSALEDARAWFEQALDVLRTLPESRSTLEEAFEVRLALRQVLSLLGQGRRVLELLREAEALAERLNDDSRRGQVCAFMANAHSNLGAPQEALSIGMRALEIARRLGDRRLRILATTYLVQAHYYRGEYASVIELAEANLAALPSDWAQEFFASDQPPSVNDRFRLLVALAHLGRFAEAAGHEADVIQLAESTDHAYTVGLAYHAASTLHLLRGDWKKARALLEHQIAVLRRGNIAAELLPMTLAASAQVLAYLGEASLALDRLREGEELLDRAPPEGNIGMGWASVSLGRASLLLGRVSEAQRHAEGALEWGSGRIDCAPQAAHLLGDIAVHSARLDAERGRGYYRRALELAESRGMRPLVAHCHLGLGMLHVRSGERERGSAHLDTAGAMYRDMDMPFWLGEAESASTALA